MIMVFIFHSIRFTDFCPSSPNMTHVYKHTCVMEEVETQTHMDRNIQRGKERQSKSVPSHSHFCVRKRVRRCVTAKKSATQGQVKMETLFQKWSWEGLKTKSFAISTWSNWIKNIWSCSPTHPWTVSHSRYFFISYFLYIFVVFSIGIYRGRG